MSLNPVVVFVVILISSICLFGINKSADAQFKPPINTNVVCPIKSIQHWDKIIFIITSPELAQKLNFSADTELDIKVLDNPRQVADIKQKVLNFLGTPNVNKSSIKIVDVDYAIVCAALKG